MDVEALSYSGVEEASVETAVWGEVVRAPGQWLTITVPFSGEPELLHLKPTTWSLNPPRAVLEGQTLRFPLLGTGTNLTPASVTNAIQTVLGSLQRQIEWTNSDLKQYNLELQVVLLAAARERKKRLDANAALQSALDIPLTSAPTERRVDLPVQRRQVRLSDRPSVGHRNMQPRLTEAVYEDVLRTIGALARSMERVPTTARFKEPELRDLILFVLNANYEGLARGEVFNGSGKTDILIPYQDRNAFIGECKFWRGPKSFRDAIDQLLGYLVWRDTSLGFS